MMFKAPSSAPELGEIPDVSIFDFMFDEKYGRAPFASSLPAYTCAVSGITVSAREQKARVETLAKALASELEWGVNEGSELDKVVAIYALNTIDIPTLNWAVHRLNGACAGINSAFTEWELAQQLKKTKPKALFTVEPLLEVARKAAKQCGLSEDRIYLCDMYQPGGSQKNSSFTSISELLARGYSAPEIEPIHWAPGRSRKQIAYLSHSSGTSGPPKLAMISHQTIIASVWQPILIEQRGRSSPNERQVSLGMLPQSHAYSVIAIMHLSTYRGDQVIVFPKFDMQIMLSSIPKYKINILNVVPPIIVAMSKNTNLLKQYDLASVKTVVSGGAPLTNATITRLYQSYPKWVVRQAYGMTEVGAACCHTTFDDPWAGSSGCVFPGAELKLINNEGKEVTAYEQTGEVWIKSPTVCLGYFGDESATKETFIEDESGRWLKSGDIGYFKKSPKGNDHIFITDRIKELIKVKANQVAPAELEDILLTHPAVAECAVIGIADGEGGEVPRAYVQRSDAGMSHPEDDLKNELIKLVQNRCARFKWLRGGIVFIELVPKSPSGKTLRRVLKEQVAAESKIRSKI